MLGYLAVNMDSADHFGNDCFDSVVRASSKDVSEILHLTFFFFLGRADTFAQDATIHSTYLDNIKWVFQCLFLYEHCTILKITMEQ